MERLYAYLAENPVTYLTREHERGEGLPDNTPGYSIVADPSKSTRELVREFANPNNSNILVFKPNPQVEEVCRTRGWRLLNPSSQLAQEVENKVSQTRWLGELSTLLPDYWTGELADCRVSRPFVLQFNISHSGEGTFLIEKESDLAELLQKFPRRLIRASRFVTGTTYNNNNVVTEEGVLIGNISMQRTGEPGLTSNRFATVGNDWDAAQSLSAQELAGYKKIAQAVGEKMKAAGWKGLFGIDCILEYGSGKWYLIEINARQPAGACYESELQRASGKSGLTVFEAHLAALLDIPTEGQELIAITGGKRTVDRLKNPNAL